MTNAANKVTHQVILQDGFKVSCWGLKDAEETLARFEARGISGKIKQIRA